MLLIIGPNYHQTSILKFKNWLIRENLLLRRDLLESLLSSQLRKNLEIFLIKIVKAFRVLKVWSKALDIFMSAQRFFQ
jgi:hypothetical protein